MDSNLFHSCCSLSGITSIIRNINSIYKNDFNLIINGKYSEITANSKKLILANHYFSGKSYTLPLILNKAIVLKELCLEFSVVYDGLEACDNFFLKTKFPPHKLEKVFLEMHTSIWINPQKMKSFM